MNLVWIWAEEWTLIIGKAQQGNSNAEANGKMQQGDPSAEANEKMQQGNPSDEANEKMQQGDPSAGANGKMQQGDSSTNAESRKLVIDGGTIKINASGDGIDSNGSIEINGGTIVVAGPTTSGDAPLDYDNECIVTGGNIIIYGSAGMWQSSSSNSTQCWLSFGNTGKEGDTITLKDSDGNQIVSVKTEKSYSAIGFSNEKIKQGNTYTLYVNDEEIASLEASSIINSNGISGTGMGGGMKQNGGNQMKGDSTDGTMEMPAKGQIPDNLENNQTDGNLPEMPEENNQQPDNMDENTEFKKGEMPENSGKNEDLKKGEKSEKSEKNIIGTEEQSNL